VLNALPAHVALLDASGVILSVDHARIRFAKRNSMRAEHGGIGLNYATLCDAVTGSCQADARKAARGLRALLAGLPSEGRRTEHDPERL